MAKPHQESIVESLQNDVWSGAELYALGCFILRTEISTNHDRIEEVWASKWNHFECRAGNVATLEWNKRVVAHIRQQKQEAEAKAALPTPLG